MSHLHRRPVALLTSAALAVLGLAGCGSSDSNADPAAGSQDSPASSSSQSPSQGGDSGSTGSGSSSTPSISSPTEGIAPGEFMMPKGLDAQTYGVTVGEKSATKELQIIEDFQCPACQQLETAVSPLVTKAIDSGALRLTYRPIAFLDRASTTRYSTRALNAAYCVLDEQGPEAFLTMHETLYKNQPAEGGAGLPDKTLITYAEQAGAKNAQGCITGGTFEPVAKKATSAAFAENINGTPTLLQDGKEVSLEGMDVNGFKKLIGLSGS